MPINPLTDFSINQILENTSLGFWFTIASTVIAVFLVGYKSYGFINNKDSKRSRSINEDLKMIQLSLKGLKTGINKDEPVSGYIKSVPEFLNLHFNKSPFIHPFAIEGLVTALSDQSNVFSSIDIGAINESQKFPEKCSLNTTDNHIFIYSERKFDPECPAETFGYQYLGCTKSGVHALLTIYHGGGSGIFYNILLVVVEKYNKINFIKDNAVTETRYRLSNVGEIPIGDRPIGAENIKLDGDSLKIGEISFIHSEPKKEERFLKIN